ncbi:MAG: 2Fe-2S iron-sulfur cluster-binding protein [Planctomycetota bacterium]
MAKLRIQHDGSEFVIEGEGLLMDLAYDHDLPISFGCQSGRCGVCQVEVLEGNLAEPGSLEKAILDGFGCPEEVRLACQAFHQTDVLLRAVHV